MNAMILCIVHLLATHSICAFMPNEMDGYHRLAISAICMILTVRGPFGKYKYKQSYEYKYKTFMKRNTKTFMKRNTNWPHFLVPLVVLI